MKVNLSSSDSGDEAFLISFSDSPESESIVVQVPSSKGDSFYNLTLKNGLPLKCNCPGYGYRGSCRHMIEYNSAE